MGFYTTDTLEAAPPRRAPARRACDGVASQRRRARRDPVCSRKPLRGPTRGAISGYRFYCPRLGRWINRDPIGEADGPNLIAFLANDPNNQTDNLGKQKTLQFVVGHAFGSPIYGSPLDPVVPREWVNNAITRAKEQFREDFGIACTKVKWNGVFASTTELIDRKRFKELVESDNFRSADYRILIFHGESFFQRDPDNPNISKGLGTGLALFGGGVTESGHPKVDIAWIPDLLKEGSVQEIPEIWVGCCNSAYLPKRAGSIWIKSCS